MRPPPLTSGLMKCGVPMRPPLTLCSLWSERLGSWIATPNPPSFTGALFSLLASNTQCGLMSRWMMSLSWQYFSAYNT